MAVRFNSGIMLSVVNGNRHQMFYFFCIAKENLRTHAFDVNGFFLQTQFIF